MTSPATAMQPEADPRPGFGAQIEAGFALWRASLRPVFVFALPYTLAGLLPLATFAPLHAALFGLASDAMLAATTPFGSTPDPAALMDALAAWAAAPRTWGFFALALLVVLFAITAILLRQHDIARGGDRGFSVTLKCALARFPAALAAWGLYTLVLVMATLPIVAAMAACLAFAWQATSIEGLLSVLALGVAASLLLSVPLAWASVAYGFAPVLATVEGTGPFAALSQSARRVRGHWVRAATLVTVPWLVYLGLAGAISTLVMLSAAAVAYAGGGVAALFAGRWMAWSQLAAALPCAALAPLPFAGLVVAWRDLQGLSGFQRPA